MFKIPEIVRQRLLLAHLTPARLTEIFIALEKAINEHQMDDACIDLVYTLKDETYGAADLLPSITISLQKAVMPPPKLEI